MLLHADQLKSRLGAALFFLVLVCFYLFRGHASEARLITQASLQTTTSTGNASIAKISVIYGELNENYIHAVESHKTHAARHGYPQWILRNQLVDGYWNKILYILQILTQELGKNVADRMKWIMWFDADSIVLNPEIPLEIFLPPSDFRDVHFLATKDWNGLNTGVFFIRVHQWSISMLVRVLGFPVFNPEVDLGFNADQTAMGLVFNESDFARHVMYQPRAWFNTYHNREGWEGEAGDILVHFPGLDEMRSPKMQSWWVTINDQVLSKQYIVPLAKTTYDARISRFWQTMREGRAMIRMVEDYVDAHLESPSTYVDRVKEELERLVFAVEQESDRPMAVEAAMERMQILYAEGLKWGHEYEEAGEVVPPVTQGDVAVGGTEGNGAGNGTGTGTDAAAGTSEDSDQPVEPAG